MIELKMSINIIVTKLSKQQNYNISDALSIQLYAGK